MAKEAEVTSTEATQVSKTLFHLQVQGLNSTVQLCSNGAADRSVWATAPEDL